MFANPILAGCYPDASVARAGDEFYLVTSSFEYFPALPVFRSSDLVNWTQVGSVISRPDQLDLSGVPSSGGLFAPTIRHSEGVFFVVCTLVHGTGRQGNFLVTATDAAGPWSDPVWIDDAPGIDPSLLFDNGRVWMCGTRLADPGRWEGHTDVWLRELDVAAGRLVGDDYLIWRGALEGAIWAEGPHIYRTGDGYLLLAAEGGTERHHAVSVARSSSVTGPYVGSPANPVLTHRHLGSSASIVGVGHAELVEDTNGDWWSTTLATRTIEGTGSILGRETNLVPVAWEKGWPVFAPGVGRVRPFTAGPAREAERTVRDDFDAAALAGEWNEVRTAAVARHSLDARPGWLRLPLLPARVTAVGAPAFVGRRIQHLSARVSTLIDFSPGGPDDSAGILLRQSEDDQLRLEIVFGREVRAVRRVAGTDELVASAELAAGTVELIVELDDFRCRMIARSDGRDRLVAATDCRTLGSDAAGGFLGVWAGMFASANGRSSSAFADFDWFEYQPAP